jgi:hypothetical protein
MVRPWDGGTHLNVASPAVLVNRGNAIGSVTEISTRITACEGRHAAESFLPVIKPAREAPAHMTDSRKFASHGMVEAVGLHVVTTKAKGCGDMWVGASSAKAEYSSKELYEAVTDYSGA